MNIRWNSTPQLSFVFFFFPRHQWHCLCATMNDFRTENITNVIYQQIWTLILLLCYAWDESETNVYHLINYRPITRAVLFCDSCERTQKPEKEKLFKFQSDQIVNSWFVFFFFWIMTVRLPFNSWCGQIEQQTMHAALNNFMEFKMLVFILCSFIIIFNKTHEIGYGQSVAFWWCVCLLCVTTILIGRNRID